MKEYRDDEAWKRKNAERRKKNAEHKKKNTEHNNLAWEKGWSVHSTVRKVEDYADTIKDTINDIITSISNDVKESNITSEDFVSLINDLRLIYNSLQEFVDLHDASVDLVEALPDVILFEGTGMSELNVEKLETIGEGICTMIDQAKIDINVQIQQHDNHFDFSAYAEAMNDVLDSVNSTQVMHCRN